jgi:hypothetical protein
MKHRHQSGHPHQIGIVCSTTVEFEIPIFEIVEMSGMTVEESKIGAAAV